MKKLLLTLSIVALAVCFFALGICASPICAEGEHEGVWSLKADKSYVTDAYAREICAKCNLVLSEEIISPSQVGRALNISDLRDEKGEIIESAPHPFMHFFVKVPFDVKVGDILRAGE